MRPYVNTPPSTPVLVLTALALVIGTPGLTLAGAAGATDAWQPPPSVLSRAAATPDRYDGPAPVCTGALTPGAAALRRVIQREFRVRDVGGYACRANTADPGKLSVHASGRALDVMVERAKGDLIANWLLAHARDLQVQLVIWRQSIWRSGRADVRRYHGPNPHTDHIHVEVLSGTEPADFFAVVRLHLEAP